MLGVLAEKLLQKDLSDYSQRLFIESINTSSNMSTIKRVSLMNECGSCSVDTDLDTFKYALATVNFSDDSTIDDRKNMLYNSVLGTTKVLNENNEDSLNKQINELRKDYIKACNNGDNERKNLIISTLKQYEQTKRRIKEVNANV